MITDEALVPSYELPRPLLFADGTEVRTPADWRRRRLEIVDLFAAHVYGTTPALDVRSEAVTLEADVVAFGGSCLRRQTRLRLTLSRGTIDIDLLVYRPAGAARTGPTILIPNLRGNHTVEPDASIPVAERARRQHPVLAAERGEMSRRFPIKTIATRGFQLATFYYGDIAPDHEDLGDGAHSLFPAGQAGRGRREWGAVGAWAWGLSRVLDWLLKEGLADPRRVAVAGHSRLGKTALWAAAQDERFAAAFANNSGCTGAALSRRRFGETVAAINSLFPHWFCREYHSYAERESDLPVDQHLLIASLAPRPVYVASAADDLWADPRGEFLGALHASSAYELHGLEGLPHADWPPPAASTGCIGYHLRPGGHDLLEADWIGFLDFLSRQWEDTARVCPRR